MAKYVFTQSDGTRFTARRENILSVSGPEIDTTHQSDCVLPGDTGEVRLRDGCSWKIGGR